MRHPRCVLRERQIVALTYVLVDDETSCCKDITHTAFLNTCKLYKLGSPSEEIKIFTPDTILIGLVSPEVGGASRTKRNSINSVFI